MTELVKEDVVEKSERRYFISEKWARELTLFSDILKQQVLEKRVVIFIDENTKEITVNSYIEMGEFFIEFLKDKKPIVLSLSHLWFPYIRHEKRDVIKKQLFSSTIFVSSNSFGDRLLSVFYRPFSTVKLGSKIQDMFDTLVTEDTVIKVFLPNELKKKMDQLYRAKQLFSVGILDTFSEIVHEPYKIKILIIHDKKIAADTIERVKK